MQYFFFKSMLWHNAVAPPLYDHVTQVKHLLIAVGGHSCVLTL